MLLGSLAMRLGNVYTDNMTNNDNSVNIKNVKGRYHHGDLRAELIRIGLAHLARAPTESLSLREIAREAGVSATAVYRHFPDKKALEASLCRAGAEQLGAEQAEAMEAAGGGQEGFSAVGRVYVRFALANPALFRLISTTRAPNDFFEGKSDWQSSAMRLLRDSIADLSDSDADADSQRVRAIQSWAMVHGLAFLMLDGLIPADQALIDRVIKA
jgi:AcrR family transcriptional regulator